MLGKTWGAWGWIVSRSEQFLAVGVEFRSRPVLGGSQNLTEIHGKRRHFFVTGAWQQDSFMASDDGCVALVHPALNLRRRPE
jgi:hypothetical protein